MSRLPEVLNPWRKVYPSDLSDLEWDRIRPLLPGPKGVGRQLTVDLREILNTVFYVQRSGFQWEMIEVRAHRAYGVLLGVDRGS